MIDKLAVKIKAEEEPIPFWKLEKLCAKAIIDKINEIITELNIILQEREHYCKVYEEVVKPAMLPEKKKKEETRPIPMYINGIGKCIVYTTCDKCVDKFQIFKTSSGKIAIYCPCCGKVLKHKPINKGDIKWVK